ncbi:hypothetical protein JMB15_003585 [Salmonella enterica]|nr:hypothetical protein [Salmonella enterica]
MNKLIAFILLLFMAPALGVAGGVIFSFWNTGNELQPVWGRLLVYMVVLVFIFNLRNKLTEPTTRATRKHRERMLMAIFGIIIYPLMAGFCLFVIEDFSFNPGTDSAQQTLDMANEKLKVILLTMLKYMPFAINCGYIWLEGIVPLWTKLRPAPSVNNGEH